jgi:hypothetical protein
MEWEASVVKCGGTSSTHLLQALGTKLGGQRRTSWMRTGRSRIEAESLTTSVRRLLHIFGHVQAVLEALAFSHEPPSFVLALVLHCDVRHSLATFCFFFCQDCRRNFAGQFVSSPWRRCALGCWLVSVVVIVNRIERWIARWKTTIVKMICE